MITQTTANQTATEESGEDNTAWTVAPFLTLVCRSRALVSDAIRIAVESDVVFERRGGLREELQKLDGALHWGLNDRQISTTHARLYLNGNAWCLTDLDSKNGTYVNGDRVRTTSLQDGDWIRLGSTFFLFRVHRTRTRDRQSGAKRASLESDANILKTLSPPLAERFAQLTQLTETALPLLIRGETGAGKELVAQEVHARSSRAGPFIAVNCGAIPESLIESELFGHRKGAFSGATEDRVGLVRAAHKGTLFLDEIGELSEGSQVALLRVLQEREVRPVGATHPLKVDVRIIAATHQDLTSAVQSGRFRDDLYARLAGHVVDLSALRQRREDLGVIIGALVRRHSAAPSAVSFSNAAMQHLLKLEYPHNIRELEYVLTRAFALAGSDHKIRMEHLPEEQAVQRVGAVISVEDAALAQRLRLVLKENSGNIAATARTFGKAPIQIRRWCERFTIDFRSYR